MWTTVITAVTAAAGLLLSMVTWAQLNSRPDMLVTMPQVIGFSAWNERLRVALQPTFTVPEKADVTAHITDVSLRLTSPGGQEPPLYWLDAITWEEHEDGSGWSSRWASDPAPLAIPEGGAMALTFQFEAPLKSSVTAGEWDAALTVERLSQEPIVVNFCLVLSETTAGGLQVVTNTDTWFWTRRTGPFIATRDVTIDDDDCYTSTG